MNILAIWASCDSKVSDKIRKIPKAIDMFLNCVGPLVLISLILAQMADNLTPWGQRVPIEALW